VFQAEEGVCAKAVRLVGAWRVLGRKRGPVKEGKGIKVIRLFRRDGLKP
jgi:hypothetical protein